MPDTIQFKNGNQIINRYDAIGRKLSTRYYTILIASEVPISALQPGQTCKLAYNMDIIDETGTFYVNNITYDFNGCDPGVYGLKRVDNVEGYGDFSWGTFMAYMYNRKDHLGNIREVWNASNNSTTQHTQYYPSGLPWASNPTDHPESQPYKYNGKEFVEMHGYDTYDYGARGYYPAIGRFMSVDPLAEMDYSVSPYAYCAGNPVNMIDPTGMMGESSTFVTYDPSKSNLPIHPSSTFVTPGLTIIEHRNDGDPKVYEVKDEDAWRKNGSRKSDAEQIGFEIPGIDYASMVGKSAVYYPSKDLIMPGWLNDKPLEIESFFEELFIPTFGFLKWFKLKNILGSRIEAATLKELKQLINLLSKPGSKLTQKELNALKGIVEKEGGNVRIDLSGVKGSGIEPHAHVEGLGKSIESRHIWLKNNIK